MAWLLVIKTGAAVPSVAARHKDFESWIASGAGISPAEMRVVHVFQNESLPPIDTVHGVIVSGSASMVTDREPWSELTALWLREAVKLGKPVLGICYGHQLLAHALGGEVQYNPRGRQIGTVDVRLRDEARHDPLFGALESTLHLPVCHRQCVVKLPPGATWLAETGGDPHHAFRIGACAWGFQFHPEFDVEIVRGYIDARREEIIAEGLDADALWRRAAPSDHGSTLLRRFAGYVRAQRAASAA